VAVATAPGRGRAGSRSLLGSVIAACQRSPRVRKRVTAVAAAVREHVTTVAAFAAVDYGVFTASHVAGWIVSGCLLLVLEWKIRD